MTPVPENIEESKNSNTPPDHQDPNMNKLKQSVDDLLQDLCLKSGKNNNDHYVKEEQHLEDLNDSAYDQIGHLDDDDVSVDDKY